VVRNGIESKIMRTRRTPCRSSLFGESRPKEWFESSWCQLHGRDVVMMMRILFTPMFRVTICLKIISSPRGGQRPESGQVSGTYSRV
jgi:hypothetical protein